MKVPDSNATGNGSRVDQLLELQRTYLHLDDDGPTLFALGIAASSNLTDDRAWGMIVGPPSGGKTEALDLVSDADAHRVSAPTTAGLLSWAHDDDGEAVPGGLLPSIKSPGFIIIPDMSSILATSNKGGRDELFAAFRDIFDGDFTRPLGNKTGVLSWSGRVTILAAVTPVIDEYATFDSALGPRWLSLRMKPRDFRNRRLATRKAHVPNNKRRVQARQLATKIIQQARDEIEGVGLSDDVEESIGEAAEVACYGRASVPRASYGSRDITGEPVVEESPRLVKGLRALARGLLAIGSDENRTLSICRRVALDSIPSVRRTILNLLTAGIDVELSTNQIAGAANIDWKMAKLALEDLSYVRAVTSCLDQDESDIKPTKYWSISDGELGDLIIDVFRKTAGQPSDKKRERHPSLLPNKRTATGPPHLLSEGSPGRLHRGGAA